MKGFLRSAFFPVLIVILSFWTVKPFFNPGFFPMHDDTQPSRIYEMAKALSSGQFPVRWVGDLGYGYGYPIFNFYAPLPYYIGAIFNLSGLDAIVAAKIMFAVGILLAGITMFFLLHNLVGDIPAVVGGLFYMYAPYHAIDVYVRGAVGEFYAMAFLPLVALGIYKILAANLHTKLHRNSYSGLVKLLKSDNDLRSGIFTGTLGFVGVLLSHNIMGMVVGMFFALGVAVYILINIIKAQKPTRLYFLLFTFLLGVGISSFFILPAIVENNFTRVNTLTADSSNYSNHFVYLDQLWSSPWGYGGSAPGRADGMSFMIGKIHLLLGLLSIPLLLFFYKRKKITKMQFGFFISSLFIFLVSVFLMLDASKFIWDLVPGFSYIQYPWRFLVFTIFSLSIMIPTILVPFDKITKIILGTVLIIFTIWFNTKYFVPSEYLSVTAKDYISSLNLQYKISKISDEYLPKEFLIPRGPDEIAFHGMIDTANVSVNQIVEEIPTRKIYNIFVKEPAKVMTRIAFFPGWKGYIDGSEVSIGSIEGRIVIDLPYGWHTVEYRLTDTPIRILANTISIFSLFLVVYIIVFTKSIYVKSERS